VQVGGQRAHDGQAQTGMRLALRALHRFEQPGQDLRRDLGTGVADQDLHLTLQPVFDDAMRLQADHPLLRRRFHGVDEQIEQQLSELIGMAAQR